jgi:hypothetical protein
MSMGYAPKAVRVNRKRILGRSDETSRTCD